ncbi:retrovirus-related Pol polyprotein from transposon 297 [Trichonephila clavipes]|nr:retrovirus-related Pol polyprotein from transposon 297 [Trichonephila clavipes]
MTCLPLAEVEIDCEWGHVITKAAVVRKQLDQEKYILGNRTIESDLEHNSLPRREIVNVIQTRSQWKKEAEQNRTSEAVEKEEMKLEENLAEDIKNLLPLFTEEKDTMSLININTDEFIEAQQKSEELAPLIQKIEKGMNNEASDYSLTKGKLLIKSRKDKNGDIRQLLVIPEKFRSSILKMGHEGTSGHLGVTKTKSRIARYFYWPQCYKEIEEFVKTCDPCQRAGKANYQKKAPMQLVPVKSEVFSKLNVDAVGPLPTTPTGNKYLLTVMCMSSKYPDAVPMPDIASTTVVEALFQIFSRMGFPKEIQTDQGTSFTSILTTVFLENFGINVVRSSVYHPQSNPIERFHRTLKRILRVICIESSPEWEKQLPATLFALRTITHESTGFTPAELVHGKNLRTPITLLYENWMGTTEKVTPVVEYVFQLINRLKSCQELAIEKMEETKIKRKAWYDKNAIKREFSEGDLVLVLKMNRPNKLSVQWKGPGKIEKKISETNYVVSFNSYTESNQVFHVNMLKPYYKRAEFINMINSRAKEDSNELEENFPCIDSNLNIFDFDEITKHSQLGNRLNVQQIEKLKEILCRYSKIFSNEPGKTHLVEHDIELINDVPIRTKPYRMSARQTDLLQEEIRKMLKYQVIEIGESDYASPMILVETPGIDPRPCIDYRKLNEVIRTQFYPLPNIEHIIETVSASKYITLLDLTKGYWQIPLTPKAQRLAAFTTSFGTYRPFCMPFGLKNAPYYLSRLMAELLQGCEKFSLPYLDDVAIFSENWDDHMSHIDKVLERIRDARLTIKPAKCKFAQDSVKYLGHVVGLGKRSPAHLKVQRILDFPVPRTKTQVRAFLGIAGYYRQYIPMFSSLAAPLTELLKGKSKKGYINWTSECQESFVQLKEKLSTNPVLYAPDFKRQFILQTDASDTGIGIVLAQRNDRGEEHPILYLSKKFSDAEREGLRHN